MKFAFFTLCIFALLYSTTSFGDDASDSLILFQAVQKNLKSDDESLCTPENPKYNYHDIITDINRSMVAACLKSTPYGKSVSVSDEMSYLCKDPDVYEGGPRAYKITNDGLVLRISQQVLFQVASSDLGRVKNNEFSEFMTSAKSCVGRLQNFFGHYDIALDLHVDWAYDRAILKDKQLPQVLINVEKSRSKDDQSNDKHYYYSSLAEQFSACNKISEDQRIDCFTKASDELCNLMLHELGHHLGLEDEYVDAEHCPKRQLPVGLDAASVMASPSSLTWEQVLFPRHITQIIAPLCGIDEKKEAQIAKDAFLKAIDKGISEKIAEDLCTGALAKVRSQLPLQDLPKKALRNVFVLRGLSCVGPGEKAWPTVEIATSFLSDSDPDIVGEALYVLRKQAHMAGTIYSPEEVKQVRKQIDVVFRKQKKWNVKKKQALELQLYWTSDYRDFIKVAKLALKSKDKRLEEEAIKRLREVFENDIQYLVGGKRSQERARTEIIKLLRR